LSFRRYTIHEFSLDITSPITILASPVEGAIVDPVSAARYFVSFTGPLAGPENDQDQTGAAKAGQDDKAAQEARQAAGLDLEQLANMSMNVTP